MGIKKGQRIWSFDLSTWELVEETEPKYMNAKKGPLHK